MTYNEMCLRAREREAIDAAIKLRYRFRGSEHVWEEYFPPVTMFGTVCLGNNLAEQRENAWRARANADQFRMTFKPLVTFLE